MKKATEATPNQRLKEARELHGWSQKYVAEQIGADHYYLSRWERGTAFPSPYYRSKLCTLFGLDAKALGLLPDAPGKKEKPAEPPVAAPQEAEAAIPGVILDPAIPPLHVYSEDLIGRDHLLSQLRAYLCGETEPGLVALYGLPGVGKTTLAVALTHDQAMQDHFHDGILWAALGPQPDILGLLSYWGTLLGVPESESQKLRTADAWIRRIRAAMGTRQMLLVIDDAWDIDQALTFKVGGPRCAYLVTSRFPSLALQLAGSGATQVKELTDHEGLRLLARLAPQVVTDEPKIAQTLVQSVGGLPLALTLMGNYLRLQAYGGQPRRLRAAIERLRTGGERLRLSGPQSLLERSPGLPPGTPISLQIVISLSEQQLSLQARSALRALAIFPAKPNSFSEEAALAICQESAEALDTLSDTGLLESYGPGRYTLHQTIADYAVAHLSDTAAYTRLADYYAAFVEQHQKDYDLLSQEMPNIFAALEAASTTGQQESFVRGINALFPFLFTRGLYAHEAGKYLEQAIELARQLHDDARLATALLNYGKAVYKQGQYARAEQCFQEARERASKIGDPRLLSEILLMLGALTRFSVSHETAEGYLQESLTLARQTDDLKLMSRALSHLGNIFSDKGHYADAEAYTHEALKLARQIDDRDEMTQLFINLSSIALLRGDMAQGEAYGQEALALARDISFLDAICAILTNMGSAAVDQGDYPKAEDYYKQALDAARQVEDVKLMSVDLASLGNLSVHQGHYEQAARYLQEALEIARRVGDIWLLSAVLLECGELSLKQQQLEEAFAAFEEARTISAKGNQEVVASSLYGLARVAAARGDLVAAQQQGQESLALFEAMGNRMRDSVKVWLQTIPGN
jgi:tetratricopeptide (TPR) repeat protein/transcriptional regulator with XRE-family HTH domain